MEAHVRRSARALLDSSPILAEEVAAKQQAIIKTVYRLKTGEVLRLA